jgi:non-specific serine/threonine protein kinase/serine/threonine-protein kinase
MGVVYKARHIELNRLVALKMTRSGAAIDPAEFARFMTEARAVARLQHPNIVQLLEIGQQDRCPWFAMEYVAGGSLDKRWAGVPLPVRQSAELVERLARAIQVAHEHGIIHRDLKPANVLLARGTGTTAVAIQGDNGDLESFEPKITDFGLAKFMETESGLTQTGIILGTPSYMAPEQATGRNKDVGPAADIYSLGAILYSMLTGRPPFRADTTLETLQLVRTREPLAPVRLRPSLPRDLETICLKCLRKDPGRRYQSATALADDLARFQAGEPIRARPVSTGERLRKWARRRPALTALMAVSGTASLVIVVLIVTSQFRLQKERDLAEQRRQEAVANEHKALRAADAEKEARERAQARESETRAVLDFVENSVFAAARPLGQEGGLGGDVTLRKAVETALPFVTKSFASEPLIEARLRMTLGTSFLYLGEAKIAADEFQRAWTIYTQHLGADHRDTLGSMERLANSYYALGRHADALKLHEETLARMKASLGTDHPDTLGSMSGLAASYHALGRYTDALSLREETLALRRARLGPDHPDTLASMHNLANSYGAVGRRAEALRLDEETLALMKVKLGPDHPSTLWSANHLANSYRALGRHVEALKLNEETLALRKARLGVDHPNTLWSMSDVASCYRDAGRHADALKLNEETLALRKAKLGTDHPDTLVSMNNLACSYAELGRHVDALKLNEETLALMKAKLGPAHPHTLFSMGGVAESLFNVDRGAEAVPIIDDCVRRAAGKVVDPSLIPDVMTLRLRHFEKTRDAAGCRTTAEMWENLNRKDAESLYNAASFRAVTAATIRAGGGSESAATAAAGEANRAMMWLQKSVAAGFKNSAAMKKDKDLDALRDRDDFKKLLAELDAKAESVVK